MYEFELVIGVIRHSAMLNASSVTFPESLDELENTSYSAITAQISIPSTLLLDRKAEGGRYHGGHASHGLLLHASDNM